MSSGAFQGQGQRLGGPPTSGPNAARVSGSAVPVPPATATAAAYATTPADLRSIPMAEVVSGPPAGAAAGAAGRQASVPNAQMAYTVRPPQPQQLQGRGGEQPGGVIVVDPALARYLTAAREGDIPPAPPDYLPLSVCSCFCCWPVALMAIYHSRLVRFFYSRGQFLQAYEASRRAKQLAVTAIFVGTTVMIIYYFTMRRQARRSGPPA